MVDGKTLECLLGARRQREGIIDAQSLLVKWWPHDAEQHRQKDERVQGAEGNDAQVHAKVENLKDLRLCEGQNENAAVGERDTRQDRAAHVGQTVLGS